MSLTQISKESREDRHGNLDRLHEITEILQKHQVAHGVTPEKLCAILVDLGPTFIKLGQILSMRSDILPQEYCKALTSLQSNVAPMPFEEVTRIIEQAFGQEMGELFEEFSEEPLGSASIGQAHKAVLKDGRQMVVKVQRPGIHDVMSRDITLLKKGAALLKVTPVAGLVDFNQVLDEMWTVAQQEMNYVIEADNLERFHALNADVAFVTCPEVSREYTTTNVLTMEFVKGIAVNDKEKLLARGYDLEEIGTKLADNYIRQVLEDGFFHADPLPGNIRIRDGKIVWIDMGMMGVLGDRDRRLIAQCVLAMARGDTRRVVSTVMQLGEFHKPVDKRRLTEDVKTMLDKYATAELGSLDLSAVMTEVIDLMKLHDASMPAGLSTLARGLATIEGVVEDLSPSIQIVNVASARISGMLLREFDWKGLLRNDLTSVTDSAHKALNLPAQISDLLATLNTGDEAIRMSIEPG